MKGYKGFNEGLTCRDKQYAENTIFEEENAEICKAGMHFCENPLDVLGYYPLIDDRGKLSEFAEVKALDEVFTNDNKKFCTKKLKIGEKLSLTRFVETSVYFLLQNTETKKASGNWQRVAARGNYSQLAASGNYAQLASSGYGARLAASGNYAQLASSGDGAQLASSGNYAQLASSGYGARLAASGNYAQLASSGDGAQLASSGNYAQLASSGYGAQLAASGDGAKLAAIGNYAKLAASGDGARLAASGNYAQLASSGYGARLAASGDDAVIANISYNGIAKGKVGTWITLAEYRAYKCVCVKSAQIDGETLKEDTWYALQDGEFKEVKA